MSVQASGTGEEIYFLGVSEDDVEFDRIEGVLHGEYQQASGRIELDEEYDVTVTERDDSYIVQVRNDSELVERNYVETDTPFEDLPESDEELYEVVRQDILQEM